MSHVPAKISTTPAQRSWPNATNVAATNVSIKPTTVTWFGVKGTRPIAAIKASARRRTQASNRVVNMLLPWLPSGLARFLVNLYHLRRDSVPRVAPRLLMPVSTHASSECGVSGQDDQRRAQLGPSLGAHRQAVKTRLQHRHVAAHLGGDHRQPRGHRFEEHDPEALRTSGGGAKKVRAVLGARLGPVWGVGRPYYNWETVGGGGRLHPRRPPAPPHPGSTRPTGP